MIKKLLFIVIFALMGISHSFIILILNLLGRHREYAEFSKRMMMDAFSYVYQYGFNSSIYYSGEWRKTNNIDILICNHTNTADFMLMSALIKNFDDKDVYWVVKKDVVWLLGTGIIWASTSDIKMERCIEKDEENMKKFVNRINDGIIIILPEGTRFSEKKLIKAQEYSKENNLPVFKNLLFPKMKGIHLIINQLNKGNKLGNLIDITSFVENFKNKKALVHDLLGRQLGNTFAIIKTHEIDKSKIEDYQEFKTYFLETVWKEKEYLLDNYNKYQFQRLEIEFKMSSFLLNFIVCSLFVHMTVNTKGIFLLLNIVVPYLVLIIKLKCRKRKKHLTN